jgi:hypothetical protein
VYLHCVLWYDKECNSIDVDATAKDNTATSSRKDETYIYVSIQDTIGRVVDSFLSDQSQPPQQSAFAKEMLLSRIRTTREPLQSNEYERLPSTLRFYEAIERQLISKDNINTVIIRFFNPDEQDDTPLFDLTTTTNTTTTGADIDFLPPTSIDNAIDSSAAGAEVHETILNEQSGKMSFPIVAGGLYNLLWKVVSKDIALVASGDPKKISAKQKVRQMQMKSKAIGDVKRIQQMEHRLFLQLISAEYNRTTNAMQVNGNTPVFVSRHDNVQRLVSDQSLPEHLQKNGSIPWELLLPIIANASTDIIDSDAIPSNHKFRLVASSVNRNDAKVTWDDLIRDEKVNCFDNVLLLYNSF